MHAKQNYLHLEIYLESQKRKSTLEIHLKQVHDFCVFMVDMFKSGPVINVM